MPQRCAKGKGTICGNACFTSVILLFSRVWGSIWGAKKKEKQSGTPSWMQSRFCLHFGTIVRVILEAKIVQTATGIETLFFRRCVVRQQGFPKVSSFLSAPRLTVF